MKDISVEEGFYPSDLKNMSVRELNLLCDGIRAKLIDSVAETGGHLASNLGVVELTVALHKVFDAPRDRIVWDVGHQSYVHKMLTGRGSKMGTLRRFGGLSGFPKRAESVYDTFDTGHSSNSVSAALGMAVARDLNKNNYEVIAVIGDGAMTGGMVYEALNNAGFMKSKMIIVLNDNGMSISQNRGSLSQHLSGLRSSDRYRGAKDRVKSKLSDIPLIGGSLVNGIGAVKDAVKYMLVPGVLFEELGLTYLGPVDGHDMEELIDVFTDAKDLKGPVIVHCVTRKGKGYRPAEKHPNRFHGVGPFDKELGIPLKKSEKPDYSAVFGKKLREMARRDERIVAVSAAMLEGTGLDGFADEFPDRTFDVGIAEEHAVTFASGLATSGKKPFASIYSTFLQRAYDQILIDVCMQKLPVVLCLDRAGVVGADGETHQGVFDLSYMTHMPNMTVLAPSDAFRLREMMEYALQHDGPVSIRYPRGEAADLSGYPEKTDPKFVGIAEEHAVTFAAGLATSGKKPFASIYSTFLQRAYDQILIDVCMQKLPVVLCLDRAGVVGADGETHQGVFDLSYMTHMPNMTVLAPSDAFRLREMMEYALQHDGPVSIRYPRGEAADLSGYPEKTDPKFVEEQPHARVLRTGSDATLAGCGSMTKICLEAAELLAEKGIECTVIDAEIIKPLSAKDRMVYRKAAEETGLVCTVEDNVVSGGYGAVIEDLLRAEKPVSICKMGWPDVFIPHGSKEELMKQYGLDAESIANRVAIIQNRETPDTDD